MYELTKVDVRFSQRRRNWGIYIGTTRTGRYAVCVIGDYMGRPTRYDPFTYVASEAEAREIANREWAGMGL